LPSATLLPYTTLFRSWEINMDRVREAITDRTRAIVVVNPNNPTGSFVSDDERNSLAELGLPIISDEVFLDYPLEGHGSTFIRDEIGEHTSELQSPYDL